jgi:hypothetical protein
MSDALDQLLNGLPGLDSRHGGPTDGSDGSSVRADTGRESRKGVPEVILADRKRPEDSLAAVQLFLSCFWTREVAPS